MHDMPMKNLSYVELGHGYIGYLINMEPFFFVFFLIPPFALIEGMTGREWVVAFHLGSEPNDLSLCGKVWAHWAHKHHGLTMDLLKASSCGAVHRTVTKIACPYQWTVSLQTISEPHFIPTNGFLPFPWCQGLHEWTAFKAISIKWSQPLMNIYICGNPFQHSNHFLQK